MPYNHFDRKLIEITERKGLRIALFSASTMTILGAILVAPALPAITKAFSNTPLLKS